MSEQQTVQESATLVQEETNNLLIEKVKTYFGFDYTVHSLEALEKALNELNENQTKFVTVRFPERHMALFASVENPCFGVPCHDSFYYKFTLKYSWSRRDVHKLISALKNNPPLKEVSMPFSVFSMLEDLSEDTVYNVTDKGVSVRKRSMINYKVKDYWDSFYDLEEVITHIRENCKNF